MGMWFSEGCACGLVAAPVQPQPLGPWRGKLSNHSSTLPQPPSPLQTLPPCCNPLTLPMAPDKSWPVPSQSLHFPQTNSLKHVTLPPMQLPTLSFATLDLYHPQL